MAAVVASSMLCCCVHPMNRQQWVTCGKFMYVAAGLQLVGFLFSMLSGSGLDESAESALVSVLAWVGAGYTAIRYANSDSYGSVQTVFYQTQVDTGAAPSVKTPMIVK